MMMTHEQVAAIQGPAPSSQSAAPSSRHRGRTLKRESSRSHAARSRSRSRTPLRERKDDSHAISSSFRALGVPHLVGQKRCMPKTFRATLSNSADEKRFPMMRLCQLEEEQVDMMNWITCGLSPQVRPSTFGCSSKREMRLEARAQAEQRIVAQPGRWNLLSEDWDNIESVAMKLS